MLGLLRGRQHRREGLPGGEDDDDSNDDDDSDDDDTDAGVQVTAMADEPPPIIMVGPANQTLPLNTLAVLPCEASGEIILIQAPSRSIRVFSGGDLIANFNWLADD